MTQSPSSLEHLRVAAQVQRPCDLVLKGGLASGLVYPRAVCRVAQSFHLVGIAGTSAGALVASIAAAAEYRRRTDGSDAGFEHLQSATEELMGAGRMLDLFRSDRETRAPYWAFRRAFFESKAKGGLFKVLWMSALPLLAVVGLGSVGVGLARDSVWDGLVATVFAGLATVALLAVLSWVTARRWLGKWRANGYGMSTGMANGHAPEGEALPPLSQWLHEQIQAAAGRGPDDAPVTFGDLHGAPLAECLTGLVDPQGGRSIDYRSMTTCLGLARPYELPLATREFGYCSAELRRLFPRAVVDHLDVESTAYLAGRAERPSTRVCERNGVRPLPDGEHMPIVMAARMSLSFPGLLSMVPLWARDYEADPEQGERHPPMRRLWFSDGGITSNFPVHRFDSVLPRWPTLAINLQYDGTRGEPGRRGARAADAERVHLAADRRHHVHPLHYSWSEAAGGELGALKGFLGSIFTSAQVWNDNGFLRLPSFRDRVAEVWLSAEEGGLNLEMPAEVMRQLVLRGDRAAERLVERFADGPEQAHAPAIAEMTWADHRWARYRASMSAIARLLERFHRGFERPQALDRPWAAHFEPEFFAADGFRYYPPRSARAQADMLGDTRGLLELAERWDAVASDADGRRRYSRFRFGPLPRADLAAQPPLNR